MFDYMSDFKDFHKVENMHFNVSKLKKGLEEVLKIKNYDSANDIPNFAAICLNQVPGEPASTKGNNARGVFWTKPDESGKEVSRDKPIDENLYTEFVKDFEHTYFKEVYDKLSSKFKLGRVRILLKEPSKTKKIDHIEVKDFGKEKEKERIRDKLMEKKGLDKMKVRFFN